MQSPHRVGLILIGLRTGSAMSRMQDVDLQAIGHNQSLDNTESTIVLV